MKHRVAAAGLVGATLAATPCAAQYLAEREPQRPVLPVEITPMAGYAFQNGIGVPGGAIDVGASPAFGATVNVGDWYGARLEVAYTLQDTGVEMQPGGGPPQSLYGLTLHQMRIGGEYDILHETVRPFVGFTLGAALFVPRADVADELWFDATLEGGAKVMLSRVLGVRAQAQVTNIFVDRSSRIFCSGGCSLPDWPGLGTTEVLLAAGPTLAF